MTGAKTFLPVSGFRNGPDALIKRVGIMSSVMYAGSDQIHIAHAGKRAGGFAVRCVKETSL